MAVVKEELRLSLTLLCCGGRGWRGCAACGGKGKEEKDYDGMWLG